MNLFLFIIFFSFSSFVFADEILPQPLDDQIIQPNLEKQIWLRPRMGGNSSWRLQCDISTPGQQGHLRLYDVNGLHSWSVEVDLDPSSSVDLIFKGGSTHKMYVWFIQGESEYIYFYNIGEKVVTLKNCELVFEQPSDY